jgi:uncharacterized protein (TIGR03083 family)
VNELSYEDHVESVQREGEALLSHAQRAGLGASVPSCPGWEVADLLRHVTRVHRWATGYLVHGYDQRVPHHEEGGQGSPLGEDEIVGRAAEAHAGLVRALLGAPPDLQCWAFLPASSPRGFWARRQAHETAVHRADAELAAGAPVSAVGPATAADGLDELLFGFLARPSRAGSPTPDDQGVVALHATDHPGRWSVHIGTQGARALKGGSSGPAADLTVTGPASALYFLAWNRTGAGPLVLEGRESLLAAFSLTARVG